MILELGKSASLFALAIIFKFLISQMENPGTVNLLETVEHGEHLLEVVPVDGTEIPESQRVEHGYWKL